jgi:hypothetical protein
VLVDVGLLLVVVVWHILFLLVVFVSPAARILDVYLACLLVDRPRDWLLLWLDDRDRWLLVLSLDGGLGNLGLLWLDAGRRCVHPACPWVEWGRHPGPGHTTRWDREPGLKEGWGPLLSGWWPLLLRV